MNSVLVVDDDALIRIILSDLLNDESYSVEAVANGEDAINICQQRLFDVALIDLELPGIKGIELLANLKSIQPKMVNIILTGHPSIESAVKAVNEKADGYILKSFDKTVLLQTIKKLIEDKTKAYLALYNEMENQLKMTAHIFDLVTDSIFVYDVEGNIFSFNEAAYKFRGYSKDEMKKMNIHDFDAPESTAIFESRIKLLLENGEAVFESVHMRKDKSLLPIEIHARQIDWLGKKLVIAVSRDITERKKAEEQMNQAFNQLVIANEKLGVVGSLTRHDVRNKLSVIVANAYLLKKKHADQVDIVEGLGKMEQAVKDSVRIFEFAKLYEQLGVEKLKYVNVEQTVQEAVTLLPDLSLKVINNCQGLTVLADSFLRQLFYNLIDNTRKYGQKTTTIRVFYEKTDDDDFRLIYEDDGVGISAENKAKLFTEGFSTGGSTGFGLFLIKKMVQIYNWTINEQGEPGKGAKFVITISRLNKNGKENLQVSSVLNGA